MTNEYTATEKITTANSIKKLIGKITPILALALILIYAIGLSDAVSEYVLEGVRLCLYRVFPTAFPFMLICDLYLSYGQADKPGVLGRIFSLLFGLPPSALVAYLSGNICGFPLGVKATVDLYRSGVMEKKDAQRLMAYSNNPSAAFVIGGVGAGMCGSTYVGVILYINILVAGLICGLLLRKKQRIIDYPGASLRQKYDFVDSVKNAGHSFVGIASFIILFSVLRGLLETLLQNQFILAFSALLLEVTNGAEFFSSSLESSILNYAFLGFTLGFGGLSVMLQSASFINDTDLSIKPYFFIKLLQGLISALLCLLFAMLLKIG